MRVLYPLIVIILGIFQNTICAMPAAACTVLLTPAKVPVTFCEALRHVGKQAEAKRLQTTKKENEEVQDARMPTPNVYVPDALIALIQPNISSIKQAFKPLGIPGISSLVLDYISNSYMHYQDLFYCEQNAHGGMKAFFPCVKLTFNEDGTHIHAQLNTSNVSSNHQLVGWSLYSKVIRSDQVKDYDLGPKESKREHLNHVVYTRFMWWQAYTQNIFNNNGDFAITSTLKVVLQYSLAQMIKAALITD